jgi:hypothetical protein
MDGTHACAVSPANYTIRVELTPFDAIERSIGMSGTPCVATLDLHMTLTSRTVKPSSADGAALAAAQGLGSPRDASDNGAVVWRR